MSFFSFSTSLPLLKILRNWPNAAYEFFTCYSASYSRTRMNQLTNRFYNLHPIVMHFGFYDSLLLHIHHLAWNPEPLILSAWEVTIFIKSLIQTAEDFLNNIFQGAVITVPATFTDTQRMALEKAPTYAGVSSIIWQSCSSGDHLGLRTVPYYGYSRTIYGRFYIKFAVTRTVKSN